MVSITTVDLVYAHGYVYLCQTWLLRSLRSSLIVFHHIRCYSTASWHCMPLSSQVYTKFSAWSSVSQLDPTRRYLCWFTHSCLLCPTSHHYIRTTFLYIAEHFSRPCSRWDTREGVFESDHPSFGVVQFSGHLMRACLWPYSRTFGRRP